MIAVTSDNAVYRLHWHAHDLIHDALHGEREVDDATVWSYQYEVRNEHPGPVVACRRP